MARSAAALGRHAPLEAGAVRPGRREMRLLGEHLRPYLGAAVAGALLLLAGSGLELAAPVLVRRAVDRGVLARDAGSLNLHGALFLAVAAGSVLCLRAAAVLTGRAGQGMLRDLRVTAFRHLAGLSLGHFERERSGSLVGRATADVEAVERLATEDLVRLATDLLFVGGATVILFVLDVRLALAALAVLPAMAAATVAFRRRIRHAYRAVRERVASVLSMLQETLRGVEVVQAFSREEASATRFREVNEEWADANVGALRIESLYFPAMDFLAMVGTGAVLVYGGSRVIGGDLTLGVLTAFTVYLSQFFGPIHHLSEHFTTLQSAMAGLRRVSDLLDRDPEVADAPGADSLGEVAGEVVLEDVRFRYAGGLPWALRGVSLRVAPGETLALVGPTGAGKSTIVKLVARFYDPTEGAVRCDGRDLREVSLASLRSRIGLVPQEGFLFGGTVRENIRFGRPAASDRDVERVCRRLGIDEFVRSLPMGYDTDVRERGARLAAGERQLVALARAALADPRVVLLDEATSSLDPGTEARIEHAFRAALAGRTTILIAHRLSTAMRADRIAVVEEGCVTECGTHDELVGAGSRYASLYRYWLSGRTG